MQPHQLTWYMQELAMHAYGADFDKKRLEALLSNPETVQSRLVWFHIASLLSHAGLVSKLVSPPSKEAAAQARGDTLKKELGIASASEVLPRSARNNTEHFDERIDNWVAANATNILEVVLEDRSAFNYLRGNEKRVRRILLQDECIFISENQDGSKFELELKPLFQEIDRIGAAATKWIKANSTYSFVYPQ